MKLSKTIALSMLAVPLLSSASFAEEEQPQRIAVGVYVLNVGKFDLSVGAYSVDIYLSLQSADPIAENSFEFMNGRAASIDKLIDEPTNKFYRVQANLYQNISLKAYPFDHHTLGVQIEDKTRGVDKVVYTVDLANSGVDPDVTIVGWDLADWGARVEKHEYPIFGETFSKFVFDVKIKRIVLTSILKAFLPACFLVLVGLLALLLKPDKFAPRLGLNTSTLLGAVMFHLTATSQIPPVGYLTFVDKFMIVSYIVLIASLISTVMLMRHTDQKEVEKAGQIYRLSLRIIPLIAVLLYLLAFLTRK